MDAIKPKIKRNGKCPRCERSLPLKELVHNKGGICGMCVRFNAKDARIAALEKAIGDACLTLGDVERHADLESMRESARMEREALLKVLRPEKQG